MLILLRGYYQKPDLVTTEGQIAHSTRKIRNAETTLGQIARDKEARELVVKNHKRDLKDVQKAADEAQGESFVFVLVSPHSSTRLVDLCCMKCRGTEEAVER